ncbi:MAG: SGNH/GDSL hydrolase family protein, partial [Gemmatimonadota bacterium]|nr:SGNH/GDSL hydrolase family protein [Gemmatimonadota bacterium]
MKSAERRPLLAVATLAASTLIALVVAELVLRLLSPDRYYVWPPGLAVQFESNPSITPGIEGLTRFTINEDGIRGRPFSEGDDYRILAIGGSTTECILLDDEEAWPRLLEAELEGVFPASRFWVGNVGKSGHSALDHVLQAEKLPPQYPRIDAVVMLVGVNDFARLMRRGQAYRSPPRDDPEFRQDLLEHAFAVVPETERSYPLHKRTELWQLARRALTGANAEPDDPDQGEGSGYLLDQRARRRRAGRVPSLPELGTALADYRRSLDEIVTALEAQAIEPVFLTQPALWREDLPAELEALLWFGRAGVDADSAREMYYA